MKYKQALAYPLLGYQIVRNPEQPTIVAIAFDTEAGDHRFLPLHAILKNLPKDFQRQAAEMPRKGSEN
jgi:hypothetical protein